MKTVGLILIVLAVLYVLRSFISAARKSKEQQRSIQKKHDLRFQQIQFEERAIAEKRREEERQRALREEEERREQKKRMLDLFEQEILNTIQKHRFALMQERKKFLQSDPYGNITDTGWGLKSSEEETGVGYFIEKVIKPDSLSCELWKEIRGADIEVWIEYEINDVINGLEDFAEANEIDSMTGVQYENFCKSILVKAGWEVEDTPASGDQGVDLIASRDDMRVCIQCKRLKRKVGNGAVQEVAAGLQHYKGTHAVVVSNAGFTKAAERLAESTQVVLISEMELEELEDRL